MPAAGSVSTNREQERAKPHSRTCVFLSSHTPGRPRRRPSPRPPPWPSYRACAACRCEAQVGAVQGVAPASTRHQRCAPAEKKKNVPCQPPVPHLLFLLPTFLFQVFISDIRACQNREQEAARVDKELGKIRKKFATGTAVTGESLEVDGAALWLACLRVWASGAREGLGDRFFFFLPATRERCLPPSFHHFSTTPHQTTTRKSTSGSCSTSTCWATTSSLATAKRPTWWPRRATPKNKSATSRCRSC